MRKVLLCLATTALASPAWANSVTINPDLDNTLIQSSTGALSNALGDIFVGRTGQADAASRRRGAVHFDVAGNVPAGSTINSVTLRLWLAKTDDTTVRTVYVHAASATTGMKNDVASWLSSPSGNYGWVLIGDESTSHTSRRFTSRESADDTGAHYPELVIDYTPPPGFAGTTPEARSGHATAGATASGAPVRPSSPARRRS
jgi:hypothetical protein